MSIAKLPILVLFGGWGREATVIRLKKSGYNIAAVVTPDNLSIKLQMSVNNIAATGIDIIACKKSDLSAVLTPFEGSILLSIGFPYLLPEDLLKRFKTVLNVHPTLLPYYRGPTTLAYLIMNHEMETGSTVHYIAAGMDTGPIVLQRKVKISPFDTLRSLQRKVYTIEPDLVTDSLKLLDASGFVPTPQNETQATIYPKKRYPKDSEIDPTKPLIELYDAIRACDPDEFPAFFFVDGQKVCIRLWRAERPPEDEKDMI